MKEQINNGRAKGSRQVIRVYPRGWVHSELRSALSKEMVRRPGVEARRPSPGAMRPAAMVAQWPSTGDACAQDLPCHEEA